MRVGRVDCIVERFLRPNQRINDPPQFLNRLAILLNHAIGHLLKNGEVLQIHGPYYEPRIVLQNVAACVPIGVEIAGTAVDQCDLFRIASDVSLRVGCVKQRHRVQRLVHISYQMDDVSREKRALCCVFIEAVGQNSAGLGHNRE